MNVLRAIFIPIGLASFGVAIWICHTYNEGLIDFWEMAWRSSILIASVLVLAAVSAVVEYGPGFGTWSNRHRHGFMPVMRNEDEQCEVDSR